MVQEYERHMKSFGISTVQYSTVPNTSWKDSTVYTKPVQQYQTSKQLDIKEVSFHKFFIKAGPIQNMLHSSGNVSY